MTRQQREIIILPPVLREKRAESATAFFSLPRFRGKRAEWAPPRERVGRDISVLPPPNYKTTPTPGLRAQRYPAPARVSPGPRPIPHPSTHPCPTQGISTPASIRSRKLNCAA